MPDIVRTRDWVHSQDAKSHPIPKNHAADLYLEFDLFNFETQKSELKRSHENALDKYVIPLLIQQGFENAWIDIEGYVSPRWEHGNNANTALSTDRAKVVQSYIIKKYTKAKFNLVKGKGGPPLTSPSKTNEGWQRMVKIKVYQPGLKFTPQEPEPPTKREQFPFAIRIRYELSISLFAAGVLSVGFVIYDKVHKQKANFLYGGGSVGLGVSLDAAKIAKGAGVAAKVVDNTLTAAEYASKLIATGPVSNFYIQTKGGKVGLDKFEKFWGVSLFQDPSLTIIANILGGTYYLSYKKNPIKDNDGNIVEMFNKDFRNEPIAINGGDSIGGLSVEFIKLSEGEMLRTSPVSEYSDSELLPRPPGTVKTLSSEEISKLMKISDDNIRCGSII
jgi:Outer membrane protein and related peptidoglycan-associated (lipo)proteins